MTLLTSSWFAGGSWWSLRSGGGIAGALGRESQRWIALVFRLWSGRADIADITGDTILQ